MNKEMLLKSLMLLLMVIVASVILIRSLSGGQTLNEYAEENNIPHHIEKMVKLY